MNRFHRSGSFFEILAAQVRARPEADAIAAPGKTRLSYRSLADQIDYVGERLRRFGLGPGDRVAVVMPNGPDLAVAFLGISQAAACAPLNPAYTSDEFRFFLDDLGADALLIEHGAETPARNVALDVGLPMIELVSQADGPCGLFRLHGQQRAAPAAEPARAEDVALLLHTSGTTSRPKLVPLRHANLVASARNIGDWLRLTPDDRCLNAMPLFHIHGLVGGLLAPLATGGCAICCPPFNAEGFFGWMKECRPTWYTAVPTMHRALVERAGAFRSVIECHRLRFIRSSSAPLPAKLIEDLETVFAAPVVEAFSMTEAAHQMTCNPLPPGVRKAGSVGLPAGVDVAIMDGEGTLLSTNCVGEVVIRGASVFDGYENNPEANAASFTNGWFRTGDQGRIDADGYLTLTGRLKEVINRGGEKVSPLEVDQALLSHPDVVEAVTFAVPHPTLGEDIGAAVVLRENATAGERDLRNHAAQALAAFKVPRTLLIRDTLPKGPTGKLQRVGMADRLGLTGEDAPATTAEQTGPRRSEHRPATPTQAALAGLWSFVLDRRTVPLDADFSRLGGDSLRAVSLLAAVKDVFGVDLPDTAVFDDLNSIAAMAGAIDERRRAQAASSSDPDARKSPAEEIPAAFSQQYFYSQQRLRPDDPTYNVACIIRITGVLDTRRLEAALADVIRRHEMLRTVFRAASGASGLVLKAVEPEPARIPTVAVDPIGGKSVERLAMDGLRQRLCEPFDLVAAPPFRPLLLRLSDDHHILALMMHHAIADGPSRQILFRDLAASYGAAGGDCDPPPPPRARFAQFSRRQRSTWSSGGFEKDAEFWNAFLPPGSSVCLPGAENAEIADGEWQGRQQTATLGDACTQTLRRLAGERRSTLFMVLLAGFVASCRQAAKRDDVVVGIPFANRPHPDFADVIGCFINTVPMRIDTSGDPTFVELVERVRRVAVSVYPHAQMPTEMLSRTIGRARAQHLGLPFPLLFQLRRPAGDEAKSVGGATFELVEADTGIAQAPLSVVLTERDRRVDYVFSYRTSIYQDATIARLLDRYASIARRVAADPGLRLSKLR